MTEEKVQTREFDAEVSQLLQLMINNLYSKKEVFLRELISNASDALDRLRFAALEDEDLYEGDSELKIRVEFDEEDRTITVWDNGIGMSREDVGEDIGTIAKSGTREFIEAVQRQEDVDDTLIGQFGVGFYSSFIVADRVDVETRKAGLDPKEGVRWSSAGDGEYTIETIDREQRGTEITLHLREGEDDLLDPHKLRDIIGKYSDHVSFPIEMRPVETGGDEEGDADEPDRDWEVVNRASALWTRRPGEIDEEEYEEFYKHVAHEFSEPLTWSHNQVEGRLKFTMLFYVPSQRPMEMAPGVEGDSGGVKLYVRRVFIMDDAEMFLPKYLRFIRGVIDSDDLDLNVSRETLQENRLVSAMKNTATRKALDMLEELAEDEPEEYQSFWSEFGGIFKEGIVEDRGNRDRVAGLLRFASTHLDREEQTVGLDGYIERMDEDQKKIYYVTAESFAGAKNSPHLEIFRDKGIEVLLMYDRVDEWVVNNLEEYDGFELESVAVGDLDLDEMGDASDEERTADEEEYADLVAALGETLGERVEDVRVTSRLRDSPACLVAQEGGMSKNFERILQQAGQQVPTRRPIMEINPDHPIVRRLSEEVGEKSIEEWGEILFDQAWLSEGGQLDDPARFVQRMNDKMIELLGEPSSNIITDV